MTQSYAGLVEPAYLTAPDYAVTFGPEVADLAESAGFAPDPEQRLALDHMFAVDRYGKVLSFECCVVCARQNMKTGLFKQAALGWLFITDQQLIVWSAHEFSTAQEAFRDMEALIGGTAALSRRIKKVHRAAGAEAIELTTGQRLKFKARTKSGGRGLTGDRVVLDEAFALQPDHMGALIPTLSAMQDPQVVYGSSAGPRSAEILRGVRDRGRAGKSSRLFYCEWCASRLACEDEKCSHQFGVEGCQLDRVENLRAANPLLGRVRPNGTGMTLEYLMAEREALPPEEFARERLGWWDDPTVSEIFGTGKWEAGHREARPADLRLSALAVAASWELTSSAVSAAGVDAESNTWVKTLQHGPGTSWVVERAKALQDTYRVPVVIDGKGPGAVLIPHLENAGVKLHTATTGDVLDAYADTQTLVRDGRFLHEPAKELDDAVAGAVPRPVGDRFAYGRKTSTADITPLESCSLAGWLAGVGPAPIESAYEDNDLMVV